MKILFLLPHPIEDASSRYRIYQFIPYLERAGFACTVSPFSTEKLFHSLQTRGQLATKFLQATQSSLRRIIRLIDLAQFDFVVIHREAFPFFIPRIERSILRKHSKVIFSFDDAVHIGHHDTSKMNHPLLYRWKYGKGIDDVLRESFHIVAGNQVLAEYAKRFNSEVSVVPTVVDCQQYTYRPLRVEMDRPVIIGWMGSRSTASYLEHIEPALIKLQSANPGRVQFNFYGFPQYKPPVAGSTSLPFRLENELRDLHSMDIGIMPLPDTPWTRGKCAFKAIQYMAAGIPTVASDVGITSQLIRHNVNGLLAISDADWFEALNRLVNDADLRRRLSEAGRLTVEREYSLQVWGPKFVSLFERLSNDQVSSHIEEHASSVAT